MEGLTSKGTYLVHPELQLGLPPFLHPRDLLPQTRDHAHPDAAHDRAF